MSPARNRTERGYGLRARSLQALRLTSEEVEQGKLLVLDHPEHRPATRGECQGGERPCPFVSCKYHLFLDVNPETGSIKLNFPDREVEDLEETCALDVADRGGTVLERVGQLLNLTRERIRQVEVRALAKAQTTLREEGTDGPV